MENQNTSETFEAALARLELLAERLQSGELPLEDAFEVYSEGKKLAERCRQMLAGFEQKLQILNENGILETWDGDDEH